MTRRPQRIIGAALFDGQIGPLSAQELLSMPEDDWGVIRDRLTDQRNGKAGLLAHCLACGGQVFIQSRLLKGQRLPFFAHYKGGDPNCPWYHGRTLAPDDARAAQYRGQQESRAHRLMCEKIAEIVQLDARHVLHTVEKYLPPTESRHGRFPDVYVEWEGFGPFAVEFQLSNTFQTEISQRCIHYEREGIPLLWILYGLDPARDVSQSFRDVIRRHRGNAFVLDHAATQASFEQRTLVLTCHLRSGDGFDEPCLVRFDELTIPSSKLPYYEDRIVGPLLRRIEERRRPWFAALRDWNRFDAEQRSIRERLTTLPASIDQFAIIRLVAAAFSVVSAANGKENNFASKHANIRAMLNTYVHTGSLAPYAALLTRLIENTAAHDLIDTSVGEHFRRVDIAQVTEQSPEWAVLRSLLPEVLDPLVRKELAYFDALPKWASRETDRER